MRRYGWMAMLAAVAVAGARAADWPVWMGPDRDGVSRETNWDPGKLAGGAKVLWRAQLGKGYSAVSVRGDRLYTMGNMEGKEVVWCLSTENGTPAWKHEYECPPGSYPGPRATPVLDGPRVYTMSRQGHVFCLDAASGRVIWQRRILADTGAKNITWGLASSALVEGDRVFLNVGRNGVALDKNDGRVVWKSAEGKGGYATPVLYRQGGAPRLAIYGEKAVYGVDPADGREVWSFPWTTSYDVHAADPVVRDGRVLISSGYNTGVASIDVSGSEAREVWRNKNLRAHFGTGVQIGAHLYGIDGSPGRGGGLACVDWATGEQKWRAPLGFGALSAAGDRLIVLLEGGDLVVVAAEPGGFRELARASQVLGRTCWTMPVLSNGRIYCRNDQGELVAVDVR